jgi:hypothetical protein
LQVLACYNRQIVRMFFQQYIRSTTTGSVSIHSPAAKIG